VYPTYNNNEKIRYENKIKNKKIIKIIIWYIKNDDDGCYDVNDNNCVNCYDNGNFYYVINVSSLSS
jgi:hypothetical protein